MTQVAAHYVPHRLPHRAPAAWRLLLVGVVLLCGTVTIPQKVSVGGVSGLGGLTVLSCLAAWALWLGRPWFPREHAGVLLPLAVFVAYSTGSLLWHPPSVIGMQNLAVTAAFLGLVLVTARHVEASPPFADTLYRALGAATAFSAVVYAGSVAAFGMGAQDVILARPFALFAMLGVAHQLARWQAGRRSGLPSAALLVGIIFLSVSRTALVASLALFPVAAMIRGDRRSILATILMGALAAAALIASIFLSETMYERFFGYDATMHVAGVTINASGRGEMWAFLVEESRDNLFFGHGAGSASIVVDQNFENLGHPHNDFLRFLYDFGLFGLACWLAFLAAAAGFLFARARRAVRTRALRRDSTHHMTPLLALVAVTGSMMTDNSVGYSFVMLPLGVLIGCALGRARAETAERTGALSA